jgi:hypothetical protein
MAHTIEVDSETFLKMFNREDDFDIDDYEGLKDKYKENDILIVEEVKSGRFFTSKLESIEIQYPGYVDFVTDSVYHLTKISNIGY